MVPPPVVTGISPKEGPPGTRITIRGEFLGIKAQDLIGLKICGCDCTLLAEWKSPNKVIARSGSCKGRGDIIVTTLSGGQGTSTVQFRGYHETIGPMKESAVWVEEAPVQSFAWGRRALSPTNYQQEDPLGLSVEGNVKKFPEDELFELYGDASGELTSEKFHPGMFLLQHHHATSLDDLKAGLAYLRRKVNSQKEGQLSFLKANVGSVMEQLDTIILLKDQFENDLKNYGTNPMEQLETAIKESMIEANKLFDDILARRDRADATRNALSVMHRYKFLFCMPINVERNIKNGNYDLVINDYARVKNLFKNTEVEVFKKVLREIEYRIETLREVLRKKLEEVPFSLEDQKKIIRNLINLEAEGDPAWDGIVSYANHLEKSIKTCTTEYLESESREDDLKISLAIKSNVSTPMSIKQFKLTKNEENNTPVKVQCIEALCDIVMEQLPDLWRLGQSYFTGQLHVTVDAKKQRPFKNLVLSSIQNAVNAMKASCDSSLEASWFLYSLKRIRQIYASLIHLDLPSDALDIFGKFIFELRLQCLVGLFKQTVDKILLLKCKETWEIEYLDGDGGITKMPLYFEEMVMEVSKLARETAIICGPREAPLLENLNHQTLYYNEIKATFAAFARCLQQLAFNCNEDIIDDEFTMVPQLTSSSTVYKNKDIKPHGLTWEQRLLISLSNIRYTLKVLLPRIEENLKFQGYPDLSTTVGYNSDWTQLKTLDTAVLNAYLERRCDPLVGIIEPNVYIGNLDWNSNLQIVHVKPYVQEILANIIAVHAEVRHVSPCLLERVLSHIVESVTEELARLILCISYRFSSSGIIQARTDILLMKKALENYCSPRAENFLDEALKAIPQPVTKEDAQKIDMILTKVTTLMQLQLSCLMNNIDNVNTTLKKIGYNQLTAL
ncbi:PREDICTED: exocyst complex component 2 [Ceratosolen solmsi marchali]|uniref:Exocyst complex component 2 n=1 Tax=Ceratosolen solmsi marchali TaxID=326594 RepID=A0AAJ6YF57_9HYME|nr:PREDICTED: exocyst complex component 2 [Ceratosolen solmsi marchali]